MVDCPKRSINSQYDETTMVVTCQIVNDLLTWNHAFTDPQDVLCSKCVKDHPIVEDRVNSSLVKQMLANAISVYLLIDAETKKTLFPNTPTNKQDALMALMIQGATKGFIQDTLIKAVASGTVSLEDADRYAELYNL